MALVATDLITPNGPLSLVLFPNIDAKALETKVGVFLTHAYNDPRVAAVTESDDSDQALAKEERMAKALALYAAYSEVYQRMVAEPLTVNVAEKGGHGYSTAQIAAMKDIRDGYRDAFEDELPVEETIPSTNFNSAVQNRFTW